jgi:DNA replicative helicase MCM subunit Mcm2 (Cdc46/Mcm family)
MSEDHHVPGPPSDIADTLNAWRDLFQRKHADDIEGLSVLDATEDPIFSFYVDFADIDGDDLLSYRFNEYPEQTIELANEVLRSMCSEHTDVRCVLRPLVFPDEKIVSVSDLRMRNRSKLVSLIVSVKDVGPRLGYLKRARYVCIECGHQEFVDQRVARERKRPSGPCKICYDEAKKALNGDISYPLFRHLNSLLQLASEGSFYQDIQYLNVQNHDAANEQAIQIIVDDEYVDAYKVGSTIRVNGVVYIDPIPDRSFIKDTRRILQVRALSIEEVS